MFDAAHLALSVFTSTVHSKEAKLLCGIYWIILFMHYISSSVDMPCMVQPIGLVGVYMLQEKRWRIPNMM